MADLVIYMEKLSG